MNPLRWLVELKDGISGTAGKISSSLREMSSGLSEVREGLNPLEDGMASGAAAGGGFVKTLTKVAAGLFVLLKVGLLLGGVGFFRELPNIVAAFKNARTGVGGIESFGKQLKAAFGEGGRSLTRMGESFFDRTGISRRGVRRVAMIGGGIAAAGVAAWGLHAAFGAVFGVVSRVVSAIGGMVEGFGRAVLEAGLLRDRTLAALTTITGSRAEGVRITAEIRELAHFMGTDLQETASSIQNLMAGGFDQAGAFEVFQAIQDLAIIDPDASADNITRAIRQIRSKGVLQMEELQSQLADAGVDVGDVLTRIGEDLGISANDVRSRISAGQISSEQGIQGILASIQARAGGGPMGALGRERSLSLGGQLQRLRNAPAMIFDAIAASSDEAFGGLRDVLIDINTLLDPTSASFRGVVSVLGAGFTVIVDLLRTAWDLGRALFEGLFGSIDGDPVVAIRDALASVSTWLEELRSPESIAWMREFGAAIKPVVQALFALVAAAASVVIGLGAAIAFIAAIPVAIMAAVGVIVQEITTLATSAWQWGADIVDGLIGGITSALGRLRATATGIATTVTGAVTSALSIHSPSRVMEELGQHTGEGFALGLDASMPDFDAAVEASSPSGRAGGGGATFNIGPFEIQASNPEEMASALRSIVLPELEAALESLAIEGGVA